jgi:hypothetical protein
MPEPLPSAPPPGAQQLALEIPANLEAAYANFVLLTHSASEVVLDFAQILPNIPKTRVRARVVMTPLNAKLLLRALAENLSKYEAQYGEIVLPTSLADQLFRPPKPPEA